jgi:CheY-like chemotaxis protein
MTTPCRILLVEDAPAKWRSVLESFADTGLIDQTTVVEDEGEALDFLHSRGSFRRRSPELPAVILLGPTLKPASAISLLEEIRQDSNLRRVPVVIIANDSDVELKALAYARGSNSVVYRHADERINTERYVALALFWGWVNLPPPGCIRQSKSRPLHL